MSSVLRHPGRNPRVVPILHALTGVLLIASRLLERPIGSVDVGVVLAAIGGGAMIVVGVCGVWRPSKWGSTTENHWLIRVYAVIVLLLALSLLLGVS